MVPAKAGTQPPFFMVMKITNSSVLQMGRGVWVPAFAGTTYHYCAIAKMPPAKPCQAWVSLIGRFRSFTAISAAPPIT